MFLILNGALLATVEWLRRHANPTASRRDPVPVPTCDRPP
jgi:hypothetical protein